MKINRKAKNTIKKLKDRLTPISIKIIRKSKIFSKSYYEKQANQSFLFFDQAVNHYCITGWKRGFNPHPIFDTNFYLNSYTDIKEANINPLIHYIQHGYKEQRDPHPYFDTKSYFHNFPYLLEKNINPITHYIEYGGVYEKYSPNAFFKNYQYLKNNKDIASSKIAPLVHYLEFGKKEGRHPNNYIKSFIEKNYNNSNYPLERGKWKQGKIIIASHEATRTGAPMIILKIAKILSEKYKYKITCLLLSGGELVKEFEKHSSRLIKLYEYPNYQQLDQAGYNQLISETIGTQKPLFSLINSAASHKLCKSLYLLKIPFFSLTHEFADPFRHEEFLNVMNAEKVIVPSKIVEKSIENKYKKKFNNILIRGQGVLHDNFGLKNKVTARRAINHELGIKDEDILILSSGYVHGRKGKDAYYHIALDYLNTYSEDSQVYFVWLGHYDPSNFNSLEYWINYDRHKLDIWDRIKFIGAKEVVEDYFLAADIFLLPSRMDPFPCVILEAMACNLPVVCFEDSIGSSEIISHYEESVASYMNIREISNKLHKLVHNTDLRIEIGACNKEIVDKNFDFDNYVEDLLNIISKNNNENIRNLKTENDPIKIIALCSDWGLSGVNAALEALGKELISRGHDFRILFTQHQDVVKNSTKSDKDSDINMTELPYAFLPEKIFGVKHWWSEIIGHYESNSPSIMITTYDFSAGCVVPALSNNVGVITWVQSDDPDYYEQTNRIGRYTNKIAVVSDFLSESIEELNASFKEKIITVYNSTVKHKEISAERTDFLNNGPIKLIYTGRLVQYQKRILDFIDLVAAMDEINLDFSLTLAGQDTTGGKIETKLKTAFKDHIDSNRVRLTGRLTRTELFQELQNQHLFMLLSDFEGLPLSLGEGMSQGCVPVVSDIQSGIKELVVDNVTGKIIKTRDYNEWAKEIEVLSNNRRDLLTLSNNSREHIRKNYTAEHSADKFEDMIKEIDHKIRTKTYHRPPVIKSFNKTGDVLLNQYMQNI